MGSPNPLASAFYASLKEYDHFAESVWQETWNYFQKFKLHPDALRAEPLVNYLAALINRQSAYLQKLLDADKEYARSKGINKGILEQLFDAEIDKFNVTDNNYDPYDKRIDALLEGAGINRESWWAWKESFLGDDLESLFSKRTLIDNIAGHRSQFIMDALPEYNQTVYSLQEREVSQQVAFKLNEAFPVNVHPSRCSILKDIFAKSPARFDLSKHPPADEVKLGDHAQREMKRRQDTEEPEHMRGVIWPGEKAPGKRGFTKGNDVY